MSTGDHEGSYRERYGRVMMSTYPVPETLLARGEGARVWDAEGREYLDFLAGIAVNALGHAHPVFVAAVADQAARLAHISNLFASEPQLALAERLCRLTGGSRAFFTNSGAEAVEAAFKLTRLTGRPRVLALEGSFHGRTMGALSLTGKEALRRDFAPLVPGVEHLDSTVEALRQAMGRDVAALIVEPIKGEAGVVPLPEGYLAEARRLTAEHGALLVVDEIQTGAGRTGAWFAYQHEGIEPDAVVLAKGIGGGFPIGALVTFGRASELLTVGAHGTTFGGNPLATAVAGAVLGEIERAGLVDNAARRGDQLRALIESLGSPLVRSVRGRGLLLGVELARPVGPRVVRAALAAGLIVNAPNEWTIRLAPPLIVGDEELAAFAERFAAALDAVLDAAIHPDSDGPEPAVHPDRTEGTPG